METEEIEISPPLVAEVVAWDRRGSPLLFVETKDYVLDPTTLPEWAAWLAANGERFPYALLVDPEHLYLFDLARGGGPVRTLGTVEVFRPYDPEFDGGRVGHRYLGALAAAWLQDFARTREHPAPPASDDLAAFGFPGLLKGGVVSQRVPLRDHPLR